MLKIAIASNLLRVQICKHIKLVKVNKALKKHEYHNNDLENNKGAYSTWSYQTPTEPKEGFNVFFKINW